MIGRWERAELLNAQGHDATTPWQMPPKAWLSVAKRTWAETGTDNIGLIAAGVAFYGFLALVPLLGAIVLIYGIAAEPSTVMHNMKQLMAVMPAEVAIVAPAAGTLVRSIRVTAERTVRSALRVETTS